MGVFNFGEVVGAFARPRPPKQIRVNDLAQESIDKFRTRFDSLGDDRDADVGAYRQALAAATPAAEKVSGERYDYLRNLIGETQRYNPLEQTYRPLGDYLFGKAADIAPAALNLTRRGDTQNRINLGLAPGSGSSVADRARMSAIGNILSQNYGSTLQALNSGFGQLQSARAMERLSGLGALDTLAAEPDRLTTRALLPSEARSRGMALDAGLLDAIIQSYKNNVAGYQDNPSGVARWGKAISAMDDSANSVLDMALSLYSGGLMGGGGGGGNFGANATSDKMLGGLIDGGGRKSGGLSSIFGGR